MKTNSIVVRLLSVSAITAACLLTSGCGDSQKASTSSGSSGGPSVQKNSFKEVTAKLDPGGNVYGYLSTEEWLSGLSDGINGWRDSLTSLPSMKAEERQNLTRGFDFISNLVKHSGVEEISGVGISSIVREQGAYHSTFVLHHYSGRNTGYLWSVFGKKPHTLAGLDFLPANTAIAWFGDVDAALMWSAIEKEIAGLRVPDVAQGMQMISNNFNQATGLKLDEALASLGGEAGFFITLDDSRKVSLPLPDQPLQVSEPGLMFIIKVKNDLIFNRLDAVLGDSQRVQRADRDGVKMRTTTLPLPIQLPLRPTIARSGDYLFIASTDTLVNEALEVSAGKKPGLKASDEFKTLSKGIPDKGNQFTYIGQKFATTVRGVQSQVMNSAAAREPGSAELLKRLMNAQTPAHGYSVSANGDEGWITIGNGNSNPARLVFLPTVGVVGLMSAIAIPNFARARATAQQNACIANLRRIDAAKAAWALENRRTGQDVPTWANLAHYFGQGTAGAIPACPQGGTYTINSVDRQPTCSIPTHTLSR